MVLMKHKNNILYKKRSGVAILGIVLVMFLVFSILTVAAFNYAIQTLRIERWHVEYQEQVRLTYIARSAVNAVAEDSLTSADKTQTSADITIGSIDVHLMISGDLDPNLYIEAEAENTEGQKSKVSALYSLDEKKIVDWSENE